MTKPFIKFASKLAQVGIFNITIYSFIFLDTLWDIRIYFWDLPRFENDTDGDITDKIVQGAHPLEAWFSSVDIYGSYGSPCLKSKKMGCCSLCLRLIRYHGGRLRVLLFMLQVPLLNITLRVVLQIPGLVDGSIVSSKRTMRQFYVYSLKASR